MFGIRKLIAKDKYGIVRGTVALVLLLVLCAVLVVELLTNIARTSVEARAQDVASRVTAQFDEMLRGAYLDLYGAAVLISEDPSRASMFLEGLYEFSPYNEVGILRDGVMHHRDGSVAPIDIEISYPYIVEGEPQGHINALYDGSILLSATINEGEEIAARYDTEALERILGSSFPEDYDFAVYNASTGKYLVNHTDFSDGGYYDALLSLNERGSTAPLFNDETAIAHIHDYGGGVFIAQHRAAARPWNVALVIPEAAVGSYLLQRSWALYALMGAVLLILATHGASVVLVGRKMREDRRDTEITLEDSSRMLNDMARQAQVTLFIYHRGQEDLMNCYDGLGLIGGTQHGRRKTSLSALEAACGLRESDVERLHDCISELKRGDEAELTLRGVLPDREERTLRFKLNAHAADGEVIVCSVRDCTQEMASLGRAQIERNYMDVTTPRTIAVWTVNVSRNLWKNLYMKDPALLGPLGMLEKEDWRDFTEDQNTKVRAYLYPMDYAEHVQQLNIPAIAESYRAGRTEFDTDYRVCPPGVDDYVWHRMHVRLYSDPQTEDILANIFVFNVDVEKNAALERGERKKVFKKTLRALSGIYYALYYVDLDNDLCYAAKSYDGEVVTNLSAPYRETFDRYLESVHPEDRDELRSMLDAFVIRRTLNESPRFLRKEYRRRTGDEYRWAAIIIQPARYENARVKDVVIAMRHLTDKGHELDLE